MQKYCIRLHCIWHFLINKKQTTTKNKQTNYFKMVRYKHWTENKKGPESLAAWKENREMRGFCTVLCTVIVTFTLDSIAGAAPRGSTEGEHWPPPKFAHFVCLLQFPVVSPSPPLCPCTALFLVFHPSIFSGLHMTTPMKQFWRRPCSVGTNPQKPFHIVITTPSITFQ